MIDGGVGNVMNGDLLGCVCQVILVFAIGDVGEMMSVICLIKKVSEKLPNIGYELRRETRLHENDKTYTKYRQNILSRNLSYIWS